jgi:hypothetical protein
MPDLKVKIARPALIRGGQVMSSRKMLQIYISAMRLIMVQIRAIQNGKLDQEVASMMAMARSQKHPTRTRRIHTPRSKRKTTESQSEYVRYVENKCVLVIVVGSNPYSPGRPLPILFGITLG